MKNIVPKTIAIDFDGCVVLHQWPFVGSSVDDSARVLRRLNKCGHTLILLTMRTDNLLDEAIEWFKNNQVEIKYFNCNPEYETGSRKVYYNLAIDDHNLGVPLIHDTEIHSKPFVDWKAVEKLLEEKGYL